MDEQNTEIKPPYIAFLTFWNAMTEVSEKPLPPSLDRTLFRSKSGTDQAGIFSAMRFFGFTDTDKNVKTLFNTFQAAGQEERKAILNGLVQTAYPKQMEVSGHHGTEKNLLESFEATWAFTGDTRRKAMTFFLHAAKHAGLELSANFPNIRAGSSRAARSGRTRRPRRTPPRRSRRRPATPTR